jgi:hypothetical protein
MRLRAVYLLLLAPVAAALGGCDDTRPAAVGDTRESLTAAAERTLAAGPSRIVATVRSRGVRYWLAGRVDVARGYRLCAAISQAPTGYLAGRVLWLEGRDGGYGTLTAHGRRCDRHAGWLDDHPSTMDLFDLRRIPAGGRTGAEDYLHSALLAMTHLTGSAVLRENGSRCGRSRCHRVLLAFRSFDREPPQRDEDSWTLRPLVRSLGRHRVEVRVGPAGFVDRLRLAVARAPGRTPRPVTVALALSHFGQEARVPRVWARAIE